MKLSNSITLLRLFLVIPIMYCILLRTFISLSCAFILYVLALLTDYLDGYFAKKTSGVSQFGKFFDPLTDKIVTLSFFVCFVTIDIIPAWIFMVLITREFVISCLALIIEKKDGLLQFEKGAQFKSLSQICAVLIILILMIVEAAFGYFNHHLHLQIMVFVMVSIQIICWFTMIFAVISGYLYLMRNNIKDILKKA
ncbi:CDP-diacylglycerol--glycerol-3-phosphate 3-phosphatidyltransferase [Chlamydiota bacterium]